jgi:phosphoglycerate dehydrogenase-like enzyme
VYSSADFATIVSKSDYLVIATPLTAETENLINASLLKHSKVGQVLINVGRGRIIVEADLIEALENGTLRGAALDVFSTEPLPATSKLWTLPNLIISPHNAYQADGIRNQAMKLFCDNCRRYLNGETLPDLVDKRRGY